MNVPKMPWMCCLVLLAQVVCAHVAFGQNRSVLGPIQFVGFSPEQRATMNPQIQASVTEARDRLFAGGATLDQSLEVGRFSANTIRLARRHWVTPAQGVVRDIATIIQPAVCTFAGHYVLIVQRLSWPNEILMGSSHALIPIQTDKKTTLDENIKNVWQQALIRVIGEALRAPDPSPRFPLLKLQVNDYAARTRVDEGQSYCLNMLLAERLLPQVTVISEVARYSGEHLRRLSGEGTLPAKANLRLGMDWHIQPLPRKQGWSLPLSLNVRVFPTESVFASDLPALPEMAMGFAAQGERLGMTGLEPLQVYLEERARPLEEEAPQIAHIYGAWVYLDKGRAWGLRMKDRLAAQTPEGPVTGHVVAYFGSEAKLQSPRGYPITEGAIVYIRNGQDRVKKGLTFQFDEKRFPAPWPPGGGK